MTVSLQLFLSLLLLLLSSKICRATGSHRCRPSSCGSIHNISYPFRLKDHHENCGDPDYELVCENNLTTVLYLNSKRFLVLSITYENFTIRLVDPGLANYNGYSSCPLYYLTSMDIPDSYSYTQPSNMFLVFISCFSQINTTLFSEAASLESAHYDETTFCGDERSIQQNYSYVIIGENPQITHIWVSCSVKRVALISSKAPAVGKSRFSDYSYGFELLWYGVYCKKVYAVGGDCFLESATHVFYEKYCTFDHPSTFRPTFKCLKQISQEVWWFCGMHYRRALTLTGKILGARFFLGILCLFAFLVHKRRQMHLSMYENIENFLQGQNNIVPIRYTYAEVKKMTNNFRDKLGEGGYGTVFKGTLQSGSLVAVKMMGKSKTSAEEFISEVATIGRVHHVNVVNLIGFCFQGSKRALVYEFMPNGSLDKYIFPQDAGKKSSSWEKMFKISLGVARGMDYLHRGCEMQILHFDIKPHNILLDENFNPKISDFGLAKSYPADNSIVSLTAARGTMGYMAPELFYENIGRVSYKADVYSFGMLLMEMAGKRKILNPFVDQLSQIYFPSWVHDQLSQGKEIEMGDATEDERKMVKKIILVALWCIQMKPTDRPSMNKVVDMLEGDLVLLEMPPKPFLSPAGMEDDHQDHEIDGHNAQLPLLSIRYRDSSSLQVEMG